jgi:hypothetical protein
MAFAADASSWTPPPQLEHAAQQEVSRAGAAESCCCGACNAHICVCDGVIVDTCQPLNIADLDRSSVGNMDVATCCCSLTATCIQNAPDTVQLDSADGFGYEDMHTLRVFVIARASAGGCGAAANADMSHGSGHASTAPASSAPVSIAPASPLETAAVADEVSTPNSDRVPAAVGDSAAALVHAPSPAPAPPSVFPLPSPPASPAFGSAGFLKSVCDGLMHKLQPFTRLLVEIIPLSLPIDVLDARCFVRQVLNADCAGCHVLRGIILFFCESKTHHLISIQCNPAVSHVQTVFLFLDDGHNVADHIPPTVRAAALLLVRMSKSLHRYRWRTLTCSCFGLAPAQVNIAPFVVSELRSLCLLCAQL